MSGLVNGEVYGGGMNSSAASGCMLSAAINLFPCPPNNLQYSIQFNEFISKYETVIHQCRMV